MRRELLTFAIRKKFHMIRLVPAIASIIDQISVMLISGKSLAIKFCIPLYPRKIHEANTTHHSKIAANPCTFPSQYE
jgi:hypothetical protein